MALTGSPSGISFTFSAVVTAAVTVTVPGVGNGESVGALIGDSGCAAVGVAVGAGAATVGAMVGAGVGSSFEQAANTNKRQRITMSWRNMRWNMGNFILLQSGVDTVRNAEQFDVGIYQVNERGLEKG